MKNVAFITGILGQDGMYLRNILLKKGYNVIGFDRNITNKKNINDSALILETDLSDYNIVLDLFKKYSPDYIFNLAGVSNVFYPWKNTNEMIKSTIQIPQNFMDCIMAISPHTVFCQASSCLVFGNTDTVIQNEDTIRAPLYPYGLSKNFIDGLVKGYREEMGMNFSSAIFYNHDSPYRGDKFFIKKLINYAKSLKLNSNQKIDFFDINIKKDLGFAGDYMEAFYLMSQAKIKDDYIVSSGRLIELSNIVKQVSMLAGINLFDYMNINSNVKHSESLLFGDNFKIKNKLNWQQSKSYEEVVELIWKTDM
jgi:GDPmannose 4,6-dehydratase